MESSKIVEDGFERLHLKMKPSTSEMRNVVRVQHNLSEVLSALPCNLIPRRE